MASRRTGTGSQPAGIAYLIGRLHRLLRRRLGEVISQTGITVQQYTVLSVLGVRGHLSNAQLAERSLITPQAANEVVKAMEERGWIDRTADPRHGRVIQLRLTDAGRDILDVSHAAVAELEEEIVAGFGVRERERFQDQLRACISALNQ